MFGEGDGVVLIKYVLINSCLVEWLCFQIVLVYFPCYSYVCFINEATLVFIVPICSLFFVSSGVLINFCQKC